MMKFSILILTVLLALVGCEKKQQTIMISPVPKTALEEFKARKKFVEDMSRMYPGAPDEAIRAEAERAINAAISELILASDGALSEDAFWSALEEAAKTLSQMDSEELDRGLAYMENIMDIVGIESSEGRLNQWRYGFDPQSH